MANPLTDLYNQVPQGYSANPKYQQYRQILAQFPIDTKNVQQSRSQIPKLQAALKAAGFQTGTVSTPGKSNLARAVSPPVWHPPSVAPKRFLNAQGQDADPTPLLTDFLEGDYKNPGLMNYMDRPLGEISGREGEIDNQAARKYEALYNAMESNPAYQTPEIAQALTAANPYYNALTKNQKSAEQHMAKVRKMQKLVRIAALVAVGGGLAASGAFGGAAAGGAGGAAAGNAAADALVSSIPESMWSAAAAGDAAGLSALGGTLGSAGIAGATSIAGGAAAGGGAALSGGAAPGFGLGTTATGTGFGVGGTNALATGATGLGGANFLGGAGAAGTAGTVASGGNFLSNLLGGGSGGGLFSGSNLASLLGTVGSIGAGIYGANQTEKAAKIQADAYMAALALQQQQYEQGRADLAPWRQVGTGALNKLGGLYGIGPDGQPTTQGAFGPDAIAEFERSPDYVFAVDQGQKEVDRSAAAKGHLYSGEQMQANQRFGQGLGTQNYNNYANRLAALAGVGQNAVDTGIQAGQNYATNAGNARVGAAESRGSGYTGQANALAGGINNALNFYGNLNAPRYYSGNLNAPRYYS